MSKISIATTGDWQGIYKDGKLVWEHHSADLHTLQEYGVISKDVELIPYTYLMDAAVLTYGSMPEDLSDLLNLEWQKKHAEEEE